MKNVLLFHNTDGHRRRFVCRWFFIVALGVTTPLQSKEPVGRPPRVLKDLAKQIVGTMRAERQWQRGQQLERDLTSEGDGKSVQKEDFLGADVVMLGGTTRPGALPDLKTYGGVYVRVVSKDKIDLRPQAVAWVSLVVGKVIAVHPENRLVVVEISDSNHYIVLMTW